MKKWMRLFFRGEFPKILLSLLMGSLLAWMGSTCIHPPDIHTRIVCAVVKDGLQCILHVLLLAQLLIR